MANHIFDSSKKRLRSIILMALAGLVLPILGPIQANADDSPTPVNNGSQPKVSPISSGLFFKPCLKDLGGIALVDCRQEITQSLQLDKFLDFVNISTPSTPSSGHARLFSNNAGNNLIAEYSDGTSQVLGSSTGGTITGVTAGLGLNGGGTVGTVTIGLSTPIASGSIPDYISASSVSATYLQQSSATLTYLLKSSATATYLQLSSATATYLQQSSATVTYCRADGTNCPASSSVSLTSTQTWSGQQTWSSQQPSTFTYSIAVGSISFTSANGGIQRYASKLVQCVTGTSTTNFATTNTSFQTTNLSAAITPVNAGNKVLIMISGSLSQQTQNNTSFLGISRGGSNITGASGCNAMFTVAGGNTESAAGCVWLDSPATTSSTGYAALLRVGGGTGNFGVNTETQSIVLCEIAQ